MKTPIAWPEAQRICDIPEVREALDKFAVDACEENMLAMVSAIMGHAATQGRAAGLEEAAKDEQSALIDKLQEALAFWLPSMPMRMGMEEMASRIEHDSWLLVGAKGEIEPGAEDSGWIIKLDASHPPVGYVHLVPDDISDNYDVRFWERVPIGTKLYAYPPGYWSDDQMIRFAAMVLIQGNKPESIATRLQQFRLNEKECGNITPPISYQLQESPTSSDAWKDDARDAARYRWLRECGAEFNKLEILDICGYIDAEALDEAIDAALSSLEVIGKGEKGE